MAQNFASSTSQLGTGTTALYTNTTSSPVDWTVSFPIEGTVRNMWNANYDQEDDIVTADGVSWNNTVQPGGTVNFGFCANR